MKISIKEGDVKHFSLCIPTPLFLNRFSAFFVIRKLKKEGVTVNKKAFYKLIKLTRKYRRTHKDWALVEVLSSDGESVRIEI